jgi:hypothetical protein
MVRRIGFVQERLDLTVPCTLLDDLAPQSSRFLASLASSGTSFVANHAMWTGPEISFPLPSSALPSGVDRAPLPTENATSFPRAGDVVVAWLAAGSARGLPPGDFFDVGIFYDEGARLLMPFGWIQANVAARVQSVDLGIAQQVARDIRQHGACSFRVVGL